MKILVFGPEERYRAYMPDFAGQLSAQVVYCPLGQSPVQAAAANPDTEILFTDPITDTGREIMDLLPGLRLIQSEGWPITVWTWRKPGAGGSMCATTRGATPVLWRSRRSC